MALRWHVALLALASCASGARRRPREVAALVSMSSDEKLAQSNTPQAFMWGKSLDDLYGLRMEADPVADELEVEAASALQNDAGMDDSNCTTELVQDGVRCGVDEVIKIIEDGLRCGFEWCHIPPLYLCPKRCEQTVRENRTCEVLVSCPVRVTLHINGSSLTTSIANMSFEAELTNYTIEQKSQEVQETLDGNRQHILPLMNEVVDIAMPIANALLKAELERFEHEIIRVLNAEIANENLGVRLLLGGPGFDEGFMATVTQRFAHMGALMHRRFEAAAPVEEGDQAALCHRLLRVRPRGGEEFFLDSWENAVVARTYDASTACSTVYSAHCHSGRLTRTTECPLQNTQVAQMCLFNTFCWIPSRTIPGSPQQVVTVFRGADQFMHGDQVTIDHVAVNVDNLMHATQAVNPSDNAGIFQPTELDALVQIKDDQLPSVLLDEICSRVRAAAWFGLGGIQAARCGVIRGIMAALSVPLEFPIGNETMSTDLSLRGGAFRAEFIPNWASLSALAEAALMHELEKETFPLNIKVQELNLMLGGDAELVTVGLRPIMTGTISAQELQELKDRLLSTPSP